MESCRTARLDKPAARLAGCREMIQITAQMRVLVAIEPVDGRKGIDSLARLCQEKLAADPVSVSASLLALAPLRATRFSY